MNAMKKLLLTLLGVFVAIPILAQDFTYTSGAVTLTYSVLDEAARTCAVKTSSSKTITAVTIPAQAGAYTVTAIADNAFLNCTALQSAVIAPTVTKIGASAFSGCKALTKVYLGPEVATIGANAFKDDVALADIYITALKAPSIQSTSFPAYTATLHLSDTQTSGYGASYWKNFATQVPMPLPTGMSTYNLATIASGAPVTATPAQSASIEAYLAPGNTMTFTTTLKGTDLTEATVFWQVSDSEKITVVNGKLTCNAVIDTPVTVTARSIYAGDMIIYINVLPCSPASDSDSNLFYTVIDESAATCAVAAVTKSIASADIPATVMLDAKKYTVKEIKPGAFYNCNKLASVTIPSSVHTLGYRAFYNTALEEVVLPSSVVNLAGDVFKFCRQLRSVEMPNSVTYLGSYSFDGCTALETVTLGSGITQIPGYCFQDCSSLVSIVVPPSVTTIGTASFSGCTALTTTYMGSKISSIGANAFKGCTSLTDIYLTAQKAPTLQSTTFPAYTAQLHLQGSATTGYDASYWKNFTKRTSELTAPESMSTYNRINISVNNPLKATGNATASKSLILAPNETLPQTTTLVYDTTGLSDDESRTLSKVYWRSTAPDKVYVDSNGKITLLEVPDSPVTLTAETLPANSPVIELEISGSHPVEGLDLYFTVISDEDATCSVYAPAYSTIKTAVIPEMVEIKGKEYTVIAVADYGFNLCTSLSSVTIPSTVRTLGYRAFYSTALTEVKIPSSVTNMVGDVFKFCRHLRSVEIPNSVTYLGTYSFDGCTALETVTLSSCLSEIKNHCFLDCSSLKSIVIPPSVKVIGSNAFNGCSGLVSIYMGHRLNNIGTDAFKGCTSLTDIYLTAQKAPTLQSTSFPAYTAQLHLQGKKHANYNAGYWALFTNRAEMNAPTGMSLTVGKLILAPSFVYAAAASSDYNTAEHIFVNTAGETHQRTAALEGDGLDSGHIFWTSSDASKAYVDHNGLITVKETPELFNPVTISAESLYADAPIRTVTINHGLMTDVPDIIDENASDRLDPDAAAEIFTVGGLPVDGSVKDLAPGIYVIRQGTKIFKITVK